MPGASGIEVVCAAMIAPVSSKWHSFKRDGGADDGRLPVEGDAEAAHPGEPIVARALQELARDAVDGGLERLVGAEDHRHRMRERERRLVRDIGQRRIGGDAQHVGAAAVAHVVGADGLALGRAGRS